MRGTLAVIEDSPVDWSILQRALGRIEHDLDVVHFDSADAALARLRGTPGLVAVLVDLNLPRLSGAEFVRALREDSAPAPVPVVVMSGSTRPEDVDAVYAAGASGYLRKPLDLATFEDRLRALLAWLAAIELPSGRTPRGAGTWT